MLTWLGAACLATTIPLSGAVVDADGHPAAGVSVWLGDTQASQKGPETLATAETDDEGRFRLDWPDDLAGRGGPWSPTLWAHRPGFRLARLEFKGGPPKADEPVRLTLGPPASIPVRVLQTDGSPAVGARVRPAQMNQSNFNAPRPPDQLLDRLTAMTDAEGGATLDGLDPGEVHSLDVTMGDELVQCLVLSPGSHTVTLRPLGRLSVRLASDDPKAPLKGWRITVNSRPADARYQGPSTHWRRETTGDDGRIDFAPMAEGWIIWSVQPPEGSDYLIAEQPAASIRAGETTEAEIQIGQGVRVEGVVRLESNDTPIPGIKVHVDSLERGALQSNRRAETDGQGRFSIVVPSGKCRFHYNTYDGIPKDYFLPPGVESWVDFEVKQGEERHEIHPPPLREARRVVGMVLDERGEPEPIADVVGLWTSVDSARNPNTSRASTDARGEFVLGNIAPGAEVRVTASRGITRDSDPVIVPKAGEGEPITIQLRKKPTRAVSGRVFDAEGHPLADALIRVMVRPASPRSAPSGGVVVFSPGGGRFDFEGSESVRTDAEGRYETPDQIPTDHDFRIEAIAPGWKTGSTKWLTAAAPEIPELRLRKPIGFRELTGRVVNSFGNPVAGVEVFQSLNAPKWERSETDAEGRFALAGVPDAPALVFASKEGHRFLGRRVEPGERSVEIVLRSFAEPPPAPLRPVASPISRDEERAIARELIAEARQNVEPGNMPMARALDVVEAWADPDRVLAMIENQARHPEPNVLEAVAVSRAEGDSRAILQLLDAIGEPSSTPATIALNLFDRIGSSARSDFRRELLERAERWAGEDQDPASAARLLARIGDGRLDLGDAERGAGLVREAQELMDQAGPRRFPGSPDILIPPLARVDLPEALKLLEAREGQPNELDRIRVEIAKRIAATNPDEARRLLDSLKEQTPWTGRRAVRLRLAKTNLEAARALGREGEDPLTDALLPAIAAKAKAATDPAVARELLRESVERLASLEPLRPNEPASSVMLARLLPLATRVDPDRAPDMMWRALAKRPSDPNVEPYFSHRPPGWVLQHHQALAELAALIARYDRGAAEAVFAPVADRFDNIIEGEGWLGHEGVAALAAAAAFDARAAKALVEALPDDPPLPKPGEPGLRRVDKFQSRTAVARILGLPPGLRFRESFIPSQPLNEWAAAIED